MSHSAAYSMLPDRRDLSILVRFAAYISWSATFRTVIIGPDPLEQLVG